MLYSCTHVATVGVEVLSNIGPIIVTRWGEPG